MTTSTRVKENLTCLRKDKKENKFVFQPQAPSFKEMSSAKIENVVLNKASIKFTMDDEEWIVYQDCNNYPVIANMMVTKGLCEWREKNDE